jgi:hypothetical protein
MMQGSEWVLERLLELAEQRRDEQEDNRRAHALNVFLRALSETEIYYGTLRDSDKDHDCEVELARLWREASEELPFVDVELAQRCQMKSRFWADPVGYPLQDVELANITIYQMREALNKLVDQEKTRKRGRGRYGPRKSDR